MLCCLDAVTAMAQPTPMLWVVGVLASQYQCASVHWMVVCMLRPVLAAQLAHGMLGQYTLPEAGVCGVVATLTCCTPALLCLPGAVMTSTLVHQLWTSSC